MSVGLMVELGARVRAHIDELRAQHGDVKMGCVRLDGQDGFLGIVWEKPGGSSAQFETSYTPDRGFVVLSPDGHLISETDPDCVYQRFVSVIDSIPEQRREAIEEKLKEWREKGFSGARLKAMVLGFNSHYQGTRGGELAPEELRYAARLAA